MGNSRLPKMGLKVGMAVLVILGKIELEEAWV